MRIVTRSNQLETDRFSTRFWPKVEIAQIMYVFDTDSLANAAYIDRAKEMQIIFTVSQMWLTLVMHHYIYAHLTPHLHCTRSPAFSIIAMHVPIVGQ